MPGPQIRVPQGQRVSRLFVNDLPQPSTVHWHGVRLVNAMDGVPELTQTVVPPGKSYLYEFEAPDAGTFWYHPHDRAWEQMARGLYGALIVEEPEPPFVDHDEVLLLDGLVPDRRGGLSPSSGPPMIGHTQGAWETGSPSMEKATGHVRRANTNVGGCA